MQRIYLLATVGAAALLSACEQFGNFTGADQSQLQKTESSAFFDAVVANSADGYRTYLQAYPSGRYSSIAVELMTTCNAGVCASDQQLQDALFSAVAIARDRSPAPAGTAAAAQQATQPAASSAAPRASTTTPSTAATGAETRTQRLLAGNY
jgi:hypothetical protein